MARWIFPLHPLPDCLGKEAMRLVVGVRIRWGHPQARGIFIAHGVQQVQVGHFQFGSECREPAPDLGERVGLEHPELGVVHDQKLDAMIAAIGREFADRGLGRRPAPGFRASS